MIASRLSVTRKRTSAEFAAAFTLMEVLAVLGLMVALSAFLVGRLGGINRSASLKSAQALVANLVGLARTKAVASGQSCRILWQVDPLGDGESRRYLRYMVVQLQTAGGWQTVTDAFLPDGVYVVPGNFAALPSGLFAFTAAVPWTKVDGTDLRSTALRSNQISSETINGIDSEQWVSIVFSSFGTTLQSGDIVMGLGHRRAPGTYGLDGAPIELDPPAAVRGLTLSAYGLPTLINSRTSF